MNISENYKIIKPLTGGKTESIPYLVKSKKNNKKYIIKVSPFKKRYTNEIKIMLKLNSLKNKNFIRLNEYGITEDDKIYYIMDFIDGYPLDEVIEKKMIKSPRKWKNIMHKVIKAYEDASKNIDFEHFDILPGNIMLKKKTFEPVIIDFNASNAGNIQQDKFYKIIYKSMRKTFNRVSKNKSIYHRIIPDDEYSKKIKKLSNNNVEYRLILSIYNYGDRVMFGGKNQILLKKKDIEYLNKTKSNTLKWKYLSNLI